MNADVFCHEASHGVQYHSQSASCRQPVLVGSRLPAERFHGRTTAEHLQAGDTFLDAFGNTFTVDRIWERVEDRKVIILATTDDPSWSFGYTFDSPVIIMKGAGHAAQ